MTQNRRPILFAALSIALILIPISRLKSQEPASQTVNPSAAPAGAQAQPSSQDPDFDPRKRQRSDKEQFKAQRDMKEEIKGAYKTWLTQDVVWIITDEEARSFKSLSNDEERDAFIEQFWLRRNPNPDSADNEFREEHYRRIQYANDHFAAGKPGWKTDRGHIYISFGAPDSIESHPSGGSYNRPIDEGGGTTSTFPFEIWHYRYLEGVGENLDLEFVDSCQCGDYHYTFDRSEKDALKMVPNAGLTEWEQMGMSSKADRFKGGNLEQLGKGPNTSSESAKEFDRIENAAKLFAPPPIKFSDLEAAFSSQHKLLSGPVFPFDVRTDFVKVTDSTVLVPVTVQLKNRDMTFVTKDGVSKSEVNILIKVTTLTHKTVQTQEDTVQVEQPVELLEKSLDKKSVYWKALPLMPGLYRLDIAIKDVNNPDHIGIYGNSLEVSSHDLGTGSCVIGSTHICPRVMANKATPVSFKRNQQLNFWMQVYNLGIDEATKSNQATVTYQIVDSVSNNVVFEKEVDSKDLGAHSDQLTVEKSLPMAGLQPGKYKVTIKVNDTISKQEIAQSAPFVVE
jgi:GWxTD domain-containing protein